MHHLDAADAENEVHFLLREIIRALVGGDAIFVEAAGLGAGLEHRHRMAVHGKAVRTGEARGSGTHHGDLLAGGLGARIGLGGISHEGIRGIALQQPDLNRLALGIVAHAGFLAQRFGRADAGAHAAEDVLVENRHSRRFRMSRLNLTDEHRNVDRGGACHLARRVMAEIAAIRLDERLMRIERWVNVTEIHGVVRMGQPVARNPGLHIRHGRSLQKLCVLGLLERMTGFVQTVKFLG